MNTDDKTFIGFIAFLVFLILCAIALGFAQSNVRVNTEYLVYTVSSDEPIRVAYLKIGYENGVLVATTINGVRIRLGPHEWKRVVEVLE